MTSKIESVEQKSIVEETAPAGKFEEVKTNTNKNDRFSEDF